MQVDLGVCSTGGRGVNPIPHSVVEFEREGCNNFFKVPLRLISGGLREIGEILDDIEGMPEKYWAGKYKYILGRNKSLGSQWEISSTMLPSLKTHKHQLYNTDTKYKH